MKLLQVSNIKVDITEDEKTAFKKALKKAGLSNRSSLFADNCMWNKTEA